MMEGALDPREQEQLLEILGALYGSKARFLPYKHLFNQRTVDVTEELLADLGTCNAQMTRLLIALAGSATLATRGWLREVLRKLAEELQGDHVALDGGACRNVVRAKGITPIINSTI